MAQVKYLMLLPLTYNDGSRVPTDVRDEILSRIFVFAGGYTIAGAAKGAYKMKGGQKQIDHSLQIWIVVDESEGTGLRNLVSEFCEMLKQETMYLECTEGSVEFIPPSEPKGGQDS